MKRAIVIVVDSAGVGELPDAHLYGDTGADTLGGIDRVTEGLSLPNLEKLGLFHLKSFKKKSTITPKGYYCKSGELSNGKDTLTGHWELMGIHTTVPFKTFTDTGFPDSLIEELEEKTGHKFIGNYSASGTAILEELGKEHKETGGLILYTSADSVLQIAANEDIVPLEELYRVCKIAREVTLQEEYKVGRIIARPFLGEGPYTRTPNRHDYALVPPGDTVLDYVSKAGLDVVSVGKINDIFSGKGITKAIGTKSNFHGMEETIALEKGNKEEGLIFVNLVDFDSSYGHRRDPEGYRLALEEFDGQLGELLDVLGDETLLIITADHGNDPTMPGTDHTREYIPVLIYKHNLKEPKLLEPRTTFADIGATVMEYLGVGTKGLAIGTSFHNLIY